MSTSKMIEGTGEELRQYLERAPQKRFRLIPLTGGDLNLADAESANGSDALARTAERDPELVARVRKARGKFASSAPEGLASEELHRERQKDKERDEKQFQGYKP